MSAEDDEDLGPDLPDIPADVLLQNYNEVCARLPGMEFPEWAQLVVGSLFGASHAWWHARDLGDLHASCVADTVTTPSLMRCLQAIDYLKRA
jgi:hypothetical protein